MEQRGSAKRVKCYAQQETRMGQNKPRTTPYSKMAANLLFFHLPHFRLKILLYFAHADEAKKANLHGYKRIIKWMPFWT